jgi:hypothetical protein
MSRREASVSSDFRAPLVTVQAWALKRRQEFQIV